MEWHFWCDKLFFKVFHVLPFGCFNHISKSSKSHCSETNAINALNVMSCNSKTFFLNCDSSRIYYVMQNDCHVEMNTMSRQFEHSKNVLNILASIAPERIHLDLEVFSVFKFAPIAGCNLSLVTNFAPEKLIYSKHRRSDIRYRKNQIMILINRSNQFKYTWFCNFGLI